MESVYMLLCFHNTIMLLIALYCASMCSDVSTPLFISQAHFVTKWMADRQISKQTNDLSLLVHACSRGTTQSSRLSCFQKSLL